MLQNLLTSIYNVGYDFKSLFIYYNNLKTKVQDVNDDIEIDYYDDRILDLIKVNNNIKEFDKKEEEFILFKSKIKSLFLKSILEFASNRKISVTTLEKLLIFGIHPITISNLISEYFDDTSMFIRKEHKYPNVKQLDEFVESLYSVFKDSYKESLNTVKLTNIV